MKLTPMLKKLFSYKNEQTHSLSFGKIIDTKHNHENCSKIVLKSGNTHSYEILKDTTHPNVLPIIKLSQQSVYTKKIEPFSIFYEKDKKKYNKYVIKRISDALEFIHTVLKKEYCALSMESVVLEESGKPLLCNFEKMKEYKDSRIDNEMLESFSKSILHDDNCDISGDEVDFFDKIFKVTPDSLSSMKSEDKVLILILFDRNKKITPAITNKYLFNTFISDVEKDQNKEYKTNALDMLFSIDNKYFHENKKRLFAILDSTIRSYLLKKFENTDFDAIDEIVSDLSLGLFVKDKMIRKQTVQFIFNHNFGTDALSFLIENMSNCTDNEVISIICENIIKLERTDVQKSIYKLLQQFTTLDIGNLQLYRCIDKYYTSFDKVKLAKNILPSLCSKLIEKENQEYCFTLVEKIIKFLKSNKDEAISTDWSFKSIKKILTKKQDTRFEDRVSKFKKEDFDEWNEYEIE